MGVCNTIGWNKFPKQGNEFGKKVEVIFWYDAYKRLKGKIIRDDIEHPFRTIIQLENGNLVLGSECQYSIKGS